MTVGAATTVRSNGKEPARALRFSQTTLISDMESPISGRIIQLKGPLGVQIIRGRIWATLGAEGRELPKVVDARGAITGFITLTNRMEAKGRIDVKDVGPVWGKAQLFIVNGGLLVLVYSEVRQEHPKSQILIRMYNRLPTRFPNTLAGRLFRYIGLKLIAYKPSIHHKDVLEPSQTRLEEMQLPEPRPWKESGKATGIFVSSESYVNLLSRIAGMKNQRSEFRSRLARALAKPSACTD